MARTPENNTSSRLLAADRVLIVEDMTSRINGLRESYIDSPNWGHAQRYLNLVGMMGSLLIYGEQPKYGRHIRRMIAFEYLDLHRGGPKPPGTDEFIDTVKNAAQPQIDRLQNVRQTDVQLGRADQLAQKDVERVRGEIITSPFVLALQRSARDARQQKDRQ